MKGYIIIPWFDVEILDSDQGANADHWGWFKTFVFKTFFQHFWNGWVKCYPHGKDKDDLSN
jgi:hypothetical protein